MRGGSATTPRRCAIRAAHPPPACLPARPAGPAPGPQRCARASRARRAAHKTRRQAAVGRPAWGQATRAVAHPEVGRTDTDGQMALRRVVLVMPRERSVRPHGHSAAHSTATARSPIGGIGAVAGPPTGCSSNPSSCRIRSRRFAPARPALADVRGHFLRRTARGLPHRPRRAVRRHPACAVLRGTDSAGLAPIERWCAIIAGAARHGELFGVDPPPPRHHMDRRNHVIHARPGAGACRAMRVCGAPMRSALEVPR
jgi:hypothetical protein